MRVGLKQWYFALAASGLVFSTAAVASAQQRSWMQNPPSMRRAQPQMPSNVPAYGVVPTAAQAPVTAAPTVGPTFAVPQFPTSASPLVTVAPTAAAPVTPTPRPAPVAVAAPSAPQGMPSLQPALPTAVARPAAVTPYGAALLTAGNAPTLAPPRLTMNAPALGSPVAVPHSSAAVDMYAGAGAPMSTPMPGVEMLPSMPAGRPVAQPMAVAPVPPTSYAPTYAPSYAPNPAVAPTMPAYGAPAYGAAPAQPVFNDPSLGNGPYAASGGPVFDDLMGGGGSCETCDPGTPAWFGVKPGCGPWFASASALIMTRDAPNNVELAYLQTTPQIAVLNSEQAGFNWTGGVEAHIGRSIGQRWAGEIVYWMLDPVVSNIGVRTDANIINSRLDTQNAIFSGVPLSAYFDNAHEQRVKRVNEFHNVELNLMQQALMVDPNGRFNMTFFTGARYFRFRETFDYLSVAAGAEFADNDPNTQAGYHIRLHNYLYGWQIGARTSMNVGNRLRLYAMPRVGIMANRISQRNELCMVIDENSDKTDVAMLGQLDLGFSYQVFRCCNIVAGYRALGIAGVANADDAIARTFTSIPAMASINSSGSLILHGAQFGVQFQF